MAKTGTSYAGMRPAGTFRVLAMAVLCAALGACAQSGSSPLDLAASGPEKSEPTVGAIPGDSKAELVKATEYWGKEFSKNPRDAKNALSYARNLKAMGEKRQAMMVLQQASIFHASNREINGEYGRLALEFDQLSVAQKLLEHADDPTKPDWRIISARGTVLAKQGSYAAAIPFYERAMALAPDQPTIQSNLALAQAMNGDPKGAETLLKKAAASGSDARVNQNLALVQSLQGKYADAQSTARRDLSSEDAAANVEYLRSIVKLDAQPASLPEQPTERVATPAAPRLKGSTTAADAQPAGWSTMVDATPSRR
jgi:Flp pilus assembly protein TadD